LKEDAMEITTTGRRYKLTPEIKEMAEKRLAKLNRFSDAEMEAHLILAEEKFRSIAELTLRAGRNHLVSREESPEMVNAIDGVVDRMERQLKKLNARVRDRKAIRVIPAMAVVAEEELLEVEVEEEFSPVVVRGNQWHQKPVTVEEAIRLMRDKDWDLMMFPNARTGRPCTVHLRPDGNYGLVEAE
jgi:putative sigma-54 modulation protein